jgi:hypothetical protein
MAETRSPLERMLDIDFSSDPRRARFPLPGQDLPAFLAGEPSVPLGRMKITREIAYDLVVNRIYRENMTPSDYRDDNRINRDISINEVRKLAREEVLSGKWDHHTPNALYFTPDGYELDGQHRSCAWLLAYIIAAREGLTFEPPSVPVVGNVPWSSFSKIDTGLPRKGHQFLNLPDPQRATMTLKYLSPMLEGLERVSLFEERADIDRIRYLESLFPELGSGWYKEVTVAKLRTGIPAKTLQSHMIAAYRAGADYSRVQEFLNPLMDTSIVLEPSDPRDRVRTHAYRVRNERNRNGVKKLSKGDEVMYANLVRTGLRNFLDDKKLDKLAPTSLGLGEIWHAAQLQQWYKEISA